MQGCHDKSGDDKNYHDFDHLDLDSFGYFDNLLAKMKAGCSSDSGRMTIKIIMILTILTTDNFNYFDNCDCRVFQ